MKNFFFLLLTTLSFFQHVNAQVTPPLGPPEVPANATSTELGLNLFIEAVKNNIQTTVIRVNRSIDSMSSSTNVRARLSHRIQVRAPFMAFSTNSQLPNSKYAKISFLVNYTISNISYHGISYFDRQLTQDVTMAFSCKQWFTENGNAIMKVSAETPTLDDASFAEQALNFFLRNTLTNLVDSKLKGIIAGASGDATTALPTGKCNCMSLSPGSTPYFENSSIRFAYVTPKRADVFTNNLTINLKSIKRLKIVGFPDPVEESINIEFYANYKSTVASVNKIKENEEQALNNVAVMTARPGDNDMLVLIGNITSVSGTETISNSMVFRKDRNFGVGTHKFIVVRPVIVTSLPRPDGSIPKPHVVYRPQYELMVQVSRVEMGMAR